MPGPLQTMRHSKVWLACIAVLSNHCIGQAELSLRTQEPGTGTGHLSDRPSLAHTMHIVVAMYREDPESVMRYLEEVTGLPAVARRRPLLFIYVKGGAEVAAHVSQLISAHEIVQLPNIGREQETYLHHVVKHYNSLPAHILFTQAERNPGYSVIPRLHTYFSDRTGALGLGGVSTCTCDGHSELWPGDGNASDALIRIREVYALAQQQLCPHEFACFHHGFFVASRARLQQQPRRVYIYLCNLFKISEEHSLRINEKNYRTMEVGKYEGWATHGHVMERSWNALLHCTSIHVSKSCDLPCEPEKEDCLALERCQCLDTPQMAHDSEYVF